MPPEQNGTGPLVKTEQRSKLVELLRSVGDGMLESELSEIIVKLVDEIQGVAQNGGGKPTGKIKLMLAIKLDRGVFEVDANVDVVSPKIVRPRTLMYVAPGGGLSRHNPQQIDAFRDQPAENQTVRTVRSLA